ncbi:histidine--tRNA ligase [Alkalicoccus urumqiensis]|uniref:Histidine--tRNA ligase n=1 Tax=Alkalicoccus urumqiensis TaxID=1548213 RepID=A0A2P6MFI2_ALKUR|nr:histidine--tRNA ligase [Alkalicoccus urumqiensis]PRO65017.1 histidine--tRNA ligase [Alkalicoccus urumqiensis]
MAYTIPRGTQDIIPGESEKWQIVEAAARDLCRRYNYKEIRTPMFEQTELFARGVGDTTDIVQKEMYTFEDRGGRSLTLRPEGTASVVRAFVSEKMHGWPDQPVKLFYNGPMFRYERPQSGRMRQFVQFGIEALGSADPALDAEVIGLAMDLYKELGLKQVKLVLNSLGDKDSREAHREALVAHFEPRIDEFCSDCQTRLHQNPLRILDCKKDRDHELMSSAPSILDYLNEESRTYFETVKAYLTAMDIEYVVDPTLVRGLDYYNNTAFEIMVEGEGFGAITTLCGGGRYNGLVEDVGGPETPGIGFGLSIERLLMALETQGIDLTAGEELDAYLVTLGEQAKEEAPKLLHQLRQQGFSLETDYLGRKMKGQMKAADRQKARLVLLLGDDELERGEINVKNMQTGAQEAVKLNELTDKLQKQNGEDD